MAKDKKIYVCSECAYESPKWVGKCPNCGSWGSLEEIELKKGSTKIKQGLDDLKVYRLNEVEVQEATKRQKTSFNEFDRVLGGGLVDGEVVLLTGSPGIGKSTLLLQVLNEYARSSEVLYISGEESVGQVKHRAKRLEIASENLYLMAETEMDKIYHYVVTKKPKVVVIDSIQTVYSSEQGSIPGSISQIRECTLKIVELAKLNGIAFFIVGHVTKDGKIAGPKLLEHMVDAVLNFEGEEDFFYRILRSEKNRFGSTNEIGIFNMEENGMTEVKNPSEFFLSDREEKNIGSIVVPVLEGSKVFLLEVQTLLSDSPFGMPKRVVQGFDRNRLQILNAIIERKLGLNLTSKDVFVNIPGGLSVRDISADLGFIVSAVSAHREFPISQKIAAIGELGLRGEIRKVSFINKRLRELEKLGFSGVYAPYANKREINSKEYNLKIIFLKNLNEMLERMN